jgi:hypothetical protein
MPLEALVGGRDVLLVPALITPLIDTDEPDCCPVRVEGEENPPRLTPE